MFRFYYIIFSILLCSTTALRGQQHVSNKTNGIYYTRSSADSTLCVYLPEIIIKPEQKKPHKKERVPRRYRKGTRAYNRTIRNLKVVYPLAQKAAIKIKEIEKELEQITDKREKKAYVKKEYKKLMAIYKEPMKKLKISQGRMLIVLVHRETGNTSFQHIRNYKGGFTAFFWQGIARLFGNNLKKGYDPTGEHRYLEALIQEYKRGEL